MSDRYEAIKNWRTQKLIAEENTKHISDVRCFHRDLKGAMFVESVAITRSYPFFYSSGMDHCKNIRLVFTVVIHFTAHGKCGSEISKDIMSKLVSGYRLAPMART